MMKSYFNPRRSWTKSSLLQWMAFSFLLLPIVAIAQTTANTKDSLQTNTLDSSLLRPKRSDVLHRTLEEKNRIQSSASVSGRTLDKSPVFNLNNALYGQLPGLSVRQGSGDPGDDGATLSLRGRSPLVLVDGIPRSVTSINPEQIESVTVLKDALSTAMLGMRGNNGAVLITTRKGKNMGSRMNFTVQTGWQTPLQMAKPLDAFNYATLYNEALANDGKAPAYTQADLDAYRNHTDPIGHPDVDWRNTLLKKNALFSRYNLTAGGDGSNYRYFLSLDYLNQQGIYKQSDVNAYSTNSGYKRYNLRGNIEVDINKQLTVALNVFGRIQEENEPGPTSATLFNNYLNTPANAYPIFNPDGSLGGNQTFQNNLYGQLINSGYRQGFTRDVGADLSIKQKLDKIAKGLWVKAVGSFFGSLTQSTNRSRTLEVFQMKVDAVNDTTYQRYGTRNDQINSSSTDSWNQQFYVELSGGYTQSFGKNNVEAIVVANSQNFRANSGDLPELYKAVNASFAYDFDSKYFIELAGNYSGNNRFPAGKQAGFFPAAGLGWNVAKEDFFKNAVPFIQTFKLRTSYGKTGNANPGYYVFNQTYSFGTGYNIGTSGGSTSGSEEDPLANPNITWEKGKKLDVGLDVVFWNDKAWLTVDYFNNKLYDLLQVRGRNTSLIGNTYPTENIGVYRYTGLEFSGGISHNIGDLKLNAGLNVSALKNRVEYIDEVNQPYPWMRRTGNRIGQSFGYIADGFFQNQQDIESSAKVDGYTPIPGDIKYKDLNGDGIINIFDETALGTSKPEIYMGATFAVSYKGFEVSVLLDGVRNRNILLSGLGQYEFQTFGGGFGQAYEQHLNRWTSETAATATYPRLTVGANPNNQIASSFWMRSGDYFRLRNAEIAYTLTTKFLTNARISGVRFFVNGFNLLTNSKLKGFDPEVLSGYPNNRTINIGATVRFF